MSIEQDTSTDDALRLSSTELRILGSLIEPEEVSAFFICGPGPMMDAAEEALQARFPDTEILIHLDPEGHTDRETMLPADITEQRP